MSGSKIGLFRRLEEEVLRIGETRDQLCSPSRMLRGSEGDEEGRRAHLRLDVTMNDILSSQELERIHCTQNRQPQLSISIEQTHPAVPKSAAR